MFAGRLLGGGFREDRLLRPALDALDGGEVQRRRDALHGGGRVARVRKILIILANTNTLAPLALVVLVVLFVYVFCVCESDATGSRILEVEIVTTPLLLLFTSRRFLSTPLSVSENVSI